MSNAPFVGLRPFKREEANIFFGREEHVTDLLALFAEQHLVTVVGTAGSGKTSLVNAGLIPHLLEGALCPTGGHWQIAEMRPGQQPFKNLVIALQSEEALDANLHTIPLDPVALQGNPNALHELLVKYHFPQQNKLLIVCDQFEELFRHQSEEAAAFINMLIASSQTYTSPEGIVSNNIYVLINLRSGYLKQCSAFPAWSAVMNKGLFLLPVLKQEQLIQAVEKPIVKFGGSIEHDLCIQLVEDAAQNHLPLLQLVLLTLWQKSADKDLTIFDYYVVGGIKSVLSNHADRIFQSLTSEQQVLVKTVFKTLFVSNQQGGYFTQPVKLADIAALLKVDRKAIVTILDLFREEDEALLSPTLPLPLIAETLVDIANESYCLQWHRVADWLEEEARAANNYVLLRKAAQQHQRNHTALLRTAELNMLRQWFEEAEPTELWSKRYGGDFKLTEGYLKKCKKVAVIKKVSLLLASVLVLVVASLFSYGFFNDGLLPNPTAIQQQSKQQLGKQNSALTVKSIMSVFAA